MKERTNAYFQWCESDDEFKPHLEWVSDDREIDVRVRENKSGDIQIFIGVYDRDGAIKMEKYIPALEASSVEAGLAWGLSKVRSFCGNPD